MLPLTSDTTLFIVPDHRELDKRKNPHIHDQFWSWVYLHGELEEVEQFDLVKLLGCNPEWVKEGVYNAVVNGQKEKHCRLYYWTDGVPVTHSDGQKSWVAPLYRGLVVWEGDPQAVEYAEKAYTQKVNRH